MNTFKRAKVVMLPTNEKADIGADNWYLPNTKKLIINKLISNLDIISDDEIKEGDWYINLETNQSCNTLKYDYSKVVTERFPSIYKKIIATTDSSLTKMSNHNSEIGRLTSPIPQPSQSFIEKYIESYNNGNPIVDIMVEYEYYDHLVLGVTNTGKRPKVNPKDNTITIKKVKDSWNREEVIKLMHSYWEFSCGINSEKRNPHLDKWIQDNL